MRRSKRRSMACSRASRPSGKCWRAARACSKAAAASRQAEAHYRQALALADELGMRPLVAHCHLGLGKLYRRTGPHEQAQEHLNTATTMYREMGMRFWLEQTEKEMAELR